MSVIVSPPLCLSVLTLNPEHPLVRDDTHDLCRMHSRIIDATVGMPVGGPRVLWATPRRHMLVIRAREQVTAARLPTGYATKIVHRPWKPPTRPGRYRVVGVLTPSYLRSLRDMTGKRHKVGTRQYLGLDEQRSWFHRRLGAGGDPDTVSTIVDFQVVRSWVAAGVHRGTDRKVVVRSVAVAATVDVHDPDLVCTAALGGIGRDKTWGCGLTTWELVR